MKGVIHNNPKLDISDASVEELKASKEWYQNTIKKFSKDPDREFFYQVLNNMQRNLDLINKEFQKRK